MPSLPVFNSDNSAGPRRRLPPWLKRPLPPGGTMAATRRIVADSGVATVCEEARCPNLTECWSHRTATFMILGDRCTRRCRFCAVQTARPDSPAPDEPARLAEAVAKLGLRHVVITAVARDDLADEGAGRFAACVRAVREKTTSAGVEVLPADFHARPELIATVCEAGPDVYNHNIETVERVTPAVRPQAKYRRSLDVLRIVKSEYPHITTKSGLMVGLGETHDELRQALADLRAVGCEVVTIGQYLQPTPNHARIARFYEPAEFEALADLGRELGFVGVASGPFVRSSYNASEVFDMAREQA
ncbi:MAG TPA: lipoyl synthase [Phycisphaerae bacterium]|nr:lipoyl synthase [Phycisphaerae bacterium]